MATSLKLQHIEVIDFIQIRFLKIMCRAKKTILP